MLNILINKIIINIIYTFIEPKLIIRFKKINITINNINLLFY